MAMAVAESAKAEAEPPDPELSLTGSIRQSMATPQKVVEHGVYRLAGDPTLTHFMRRLKERSTAKPANYASVSSDDEEQTRLNEWLAHSNSFGYTHAVRTRPEPDPVLDWIEIHGERVPAPMRLKCVRLLVKDPISGEKFPKWELRRDQNLTPDNFVEHPSQYIDDWSEVGVARAKKKYLEREEASRKKRELLGKDPVAPVAVSKRLVRRPPSVMWFLKNPDGRGLIYPDVYPTNVSEEDVQIMRGHNAYAEGIVEHWEELKQEVIDQVFPLRHDLISKAEEAEDEKHKEALKEYAEELKSSETVYTELQEVQQEVVSELLPAICAVRPVHVNRHSWPWKRPMKADGWSEDENFIGRLAPHELRQHNEPVEMAANDPVMEADSELPARGISYFDLRVDEGEDQTNRYIAAARTNLELMRYEAETKDHVEEVVRPLFQGLHDLGYQEVKGYPDDGRQTLLIGGGSYHFDYNDARTMQMIRALIKRQTRLLRLLRSKLVMAKVAQGGLSKFLEEDEDLNDYEYNIEGLVDDGVLEVDVEINVERAEKMGRPEPELHNQCEYERYKAECRELDQTQYMKNRKKFFERSAKIEKKRVRAVRMARNNAIAYQRKKQNALRKYYYDLLYKVRKINEPMQEKPVQMQNFLLPPADWKERLADWWSEHNPMLKGLRERAHRMEMKLLDYDTTKLRAADGRDFWYMRQLRIEGRGSAKGWAIAETLEIEKSLRQGTVSATHREMLTEKVPEQVDNQQSKHEEWDHFGWKIFENLTPPAVQETAKKPEVPIRAPSGTVYETKKIARISGGDYETPLGMLWKKYITTFGGPQPRYSREEIEHETVEETDKDQKVGLAAYKPAGVRKPYHPRIAQRYARHRAQRQSRLVA